MTNTRQSDIQMIATALAEAGVERGSVGADWAARIVDSGLLLRIRADAYSEGHEEGYKDGYDEGYNNGFEIGFSTTTSFED